MCARTVDTNRHVVAAAAATDDVIPVSWLIHGDVFCTVLPLLSSTFLCRRTSVSPLLRGPLRVGSICSESRPSVRQSICH